MHKVYRIFFDLFLYVVYPFQYNRKIIKERENSTETSKQ